MIVNITNANGGNFGLRRNKMFKTIDKMYDLSQAKDFLGISVEKC